MRPMHKRRHKEYNKNLLYRPSKALYRHWGATATQWWENIHNFFQNSKLLKSLHQVGCHNFTETLTPSSRGLDWQGGGGGEGEGGETDWGEGETKHESGIIKQMEDLCQRKMTEYKVERDDEK